MQKITLLPICFSVLELFIVPHPTRSSKVPQYLIHVIPAYQYFTDKIVGQSESDERAEFAEEEGDKVGSVGEEEEEDEDDDVESVEGSADRPLDIQTCTMM